MLKLEPTSKFRRDVRRLNRRGYDLSKLIDIANRLAREETLPPQNRDHPLTGEYKGCRECHIAPDWLLIYRVDRCRLVLIEHRTGTHSDLFDE